MSGKGQSQRLDRKGLLQLRILRLGFLQDGNFEIGEPAPSLTPQSDALGMNEPASRNSLLVRNQFHIDYCTVRVTVPLALVLPDVPVTVTV